MPRASSILPIVLAPRVTALRARWKRGPEVGSRIARDLLLVSLTGVVSYGLFAGTRWTLIQLQSILDFAYMPPSLLLGLILLFLGGMLFVTNTVAAIGALFLSQDVETLLASPISMYRLYAGKVLEVICISSWMTLVFLLPVLTGFASFYQWPPLFWFHCVLVLLPFLLIPAATSVVLATFVRMVSPRVSARQVAVVAGLCIAAGVWYAVGLLSNRLEEDAPIAVADILQVVSFLSLANVPWTPAYWVSAALGEVLAPTGKSTTPALLLLYSTALGSGALGFAIFRITFFKLYALTTKVTLSAEGESERHRRRIMRMLRGFSPPTKALVFKEWTLFSRDITQVVQFVLLFSICLLYLYMLGLQSNLERALPAAQQKWWKLFLFLTNSCIEAFVVTAMGTRLVFPSVSREGQAFWILEKSPVAVQTILRVKFWFWFIPLATVALLVFGAASYFLYASIPLALGKAFATLVVTAALVGMGLGFGSAFASFSWQHASELIASFGSLMYMICAVLLIVTSLSIQAILAFMWIKGRLSGAFFSPPVLTGISLATLGVTVNLAVAYYSLRIAERSLLKRRS